MVKYCTCTCHTTWKSNLLKELSQLKGKSEKLGGHALGNITRIEFQETNNGYYYEIAAQGMVYGLKYRDFDG